MIIIKEGKFVLIGTAVLSVVMHDNCIVGILEGKDLVAYDEGYADELQEMKLAISTTLIPEDKFKNRVNCLRISLFQQSSKPEFSNPLSESFFLDYVKGIDLRLQQLVQGKLVEYNEGEGSQAQWCEGYLLGFVDEDVIDNVRGELTMVRYAYAVIEDKEHGTIIKRPIDRGEWRTKRFNGENDN